jgi:predicted MFS family arabinose efflux permease
MGLLVTFTQLGYAAGIFTLVPLGDVLNKKKLILGKLGGLVLALIGVGLAKTVVQLVICSFAVGILSTAAQDFVPLAAELAEPKRRGQVIGIVMGGLLLGILVSRTFSGLVAGHFGWRAVFFVSSVIIALLALLVVALVPSVAKPASTSYPTLLRSMATLLRRHPTLGLSVLTQGVMGTIFSAFWTVLSFHLSRDPFHLSTSQIGYFGLAGAVGALAAPAAGKLADKRGPLANIPIAIGLTFASFALLFFFPTSLGVLIGCTALFDLGVQMSMVSHQTIIYALDPTARSRINAVFVSGVFIFFALGSFLGTALFNRFGWPGVVLLCLAQCVIAFGLHIVLRRFAARSPLVHGRERPANSIAS